MNGSNKAKRISGLDLARALAIAGMVVVNFKTVLGAGANGPAFLVKLAGLLEGRAAATFVILAGVGLSLMSGGGKDKRRLQKSRSLLMGRSLFLLIGGLAFSLIWPPDILHYYAIYIAVGLCFLGSSNGKILGAVALFILGFPILLLFFDYGAGWNWETLSYAGFWTPSGMIRNLFFNGFHPVFPWTAFLLFGMWLGRKDLRNSSVLRAMLAGGAALWLAAEGISRLLILAAQARPGSDLHAFLGTNILPPTPLYMLAGMGAGCMAISLCLYFTSSFPNSKIASLLIPTGQLALTHYAGHVILGFGVMEVMGRMQNQTLVFALGASAAYMIFAVVFSLLWRRRFSRGPLEWVMRKTTGQSRNGSDRRRDQAPGTAILEG